MDVHALVFLLYTKKSANDCVAGDIRNVLGAIIVATLKAVATISIIAVRRVGDMRCIITVGTRGLFEEDAVWVVDADVHRLLIVDTTHI